LRGQGDACWFYWYENAQIETLTAQWLQSTADADRLRLADAIQREAFETVPSIPLGQFFIRSAYRADLLALLEGTATYSWNVRRGWRSGVRSRETRWQKVPLCIEYPNR
jgi:peptide/nickel transport system substrate-binding protein